MSNNIDQPEATPVSVMMGGLPDGCIPYILRYLSHRDMNILGMLCQFWRRSVGEHLVPTPYGTAFDFDRKTIRFPDTTVNPFTSCGMIGSHCICAGRTEVKLVASFDYEQGGYMIKVGFMRPPDHARDFVVTVGGLEGDSDSEAEIDEDHPQFYDLQSSIRCAAAFDDFRKPRSCRLPSEYADKMHGVFVNLNLCRKSLRGQYHYDTNLSAFKHVSKDSVLTTEFHPHQLDSDRNKDFPQDITFILSRTEVGALRIHVKAPYHTGPNVHPIIDCYTEVRDLLVEGPYTWFVDITKLPGPGDFNTEEHVEEGPNKKAKRNNDSTSVTWS